MSPVFDDGSRNFSIDWQLPTNFNYKVFSYLNHLISVLSWGDLVGNHEALDLLDCHWVEEHANKLQEKDTERLNGITLCGWDISEPTSGECCCNKVNCDDVLIWEIEFIDISSAHPRVIEGAVFSYLTKHDHRASEDMQIDQSWHTELQYIKDPFELLYLEHSLWLAIVLKNLGYLPINFKKSDVSNDFKKSIKHTLWVIIIFKNNGRKTNENL